MGERIGFVGLGIMGAPMARNLIEAGYDLTVHNRTRSKAEPLIALGAESAESPAAAAASSDIVLTMLPGPPEVEEVVGALIKACREGSLVVDMSTSSPLLARDLALRAGERGVGTLDAPVSGGDEGARDGTLSIMVGGGEAGFHRALPLFEVMGRTVVHVGEAGAGQTVKACNQIVVALVIQAVSEALALATSAGVEPKVLLDALSGGLAASSVIDVKGGKLVSRDFEPGGKVLYHKKDLGIALSAAREHGVFVPATALVEDFFGALVAKGRGGWDHSSLVTLVEDWSARD